MTPEPPRPLELHHLALGAVDVERVAGFYRDVFGLRERTRHLHEDGTLRSIWLELGSALLMIERCATVRDPVSGVGGGLFLLALRVTREERDQLEARLLRAGAAVEARTVATSYARDPEGNRVAVSEY